MSPLKPATRDKLRTVSTATICTALYKRGFRNQMIQDVHPLNPEQPKMVGPAFTLRYIPTREDLNPIAVFQDRGHPQRKAADDCPPGAVFVVDSRKDARRLGRLDLVTRLMKRGVADVVTNGGLRDARRSPGCRSRCITGGPRHRQTSHPAPGGHINVPIGCGDALVWPGDVIVGDGDSVVVIPAHLADEAAEMTVFEDFVTEKVLDGRLILGLYPPTNEQT